MTDRIDMHISGSSTMPGGDYRTVSISGAGKIMGSLRCERLDISGSGKVEGDVRCTGKIETSGAGKVLGRVEAGNLEASGALTVERDCVVEQEVECSGASKFLGSLSANRITLSGACACEGDVSAEKFYSTGACRIRGLLNAERVELKLGGDSEIGDIGGAEILVRGSMRWHLFRSYTRELHTNTVEGDNVDLESTVADTVRGSVVRIGPGCRIRRVEYTESLVVAPEAQVEEQVQVGRRELPEGQ